MGEGCESNKCRANKKLLTPEILAKFGHVKKKQYNDFKRCNKKIHGKIYGEFGEFYYCEECYAEVDNSVHKVWKDGAGMEPFPFPTHTLPYQKVWVKMVYELHPEMKPLEAVEENSEAEENSAKKANELTKNHDQMIDNIKQWIEKYSKNISYEMGQELSQIILSEWI